MRNKILLKSSSAVIALLLISGCGQEEIDASQTREISGLTYRIESNTPFTGIVKNYPITVADVMSLGSCNMPLKNGKPEGKAECFANNGTKIAEANFIEGKKNGKETTWNHSTQKVQEENEWLAGRQHGEQKRYNPQSGKLIRLIQMHEGKPEGVEKEWTADGSKLATDLIWKNGKKSGKQTSPYLVENFLDGQLHGEKIALDSYGSTPYIKSISNYEHGHKNSEKKFDHLGNITFEGSWKNKILQTSLTQEWKDGKVIERLNLINTDPEWDDPWSEPPMVKNGEEKYHTTPEEYYQVTWDMGKPLKGSFRYSDSEGKHVYGYDGVPTNDHRALVKNGTELYMYSSHSEIKELQWKNGALDSEIPPQATPDFFKQSGCDDCLRRALAQSAYNQQNSSNQGEACYNEKLNAIHQENPNFPISFDMMNEMRAECGLPSEE
ncbi:hypothetical protein RTH74_20600 [Pseudomonas sp. zfem001]|uniref:toxin-antitoxin system YwqK family antitoxin n=1 Tax=Pseudomonas sp. zfem001 TaxID=3078196 RepID=UPI0029291384|nr:hypothetical protein [Pseudomonas sp. zfem001]MDU9410015.1 hypothetical protein [Pseudomonas sp. zfem001]